MSERDSKGRRFVTVDTGGPDDVFRGALVLWLHTPRGGYGYTVAIDATVVTARRSGVQISVQTRSGAIVKRTVQASNLRWRSP